MDFNRRDFLSKTIKTLGIGTVASPFFGQSAFGQITDSLGENLKAGVIPLFQGMTNETETVIVSMVKKDHSYSYRALGANDQVMESKIYLREERSHSAFAIEKIRVSGLSVGESYRFQVLDNATGLTVDEREFYSLDLNDSSAHFVIGSCMFDYLAIDTSKMWKSLLNTKPSVIFLIGDQVYADFAADESEKDFWRRYTEVRSKLWIFKSPRLTPILTTWDDHDYGTNNGNKEFRLKDDTKTIFKTFWGNEPMHGLEEGWGVGTVFSAWGQRFFLMDDRYYRDVKNTGGLHWGQDQEDFLFEKLATNKNPAWLLNGSQFFGGYLAKDNFESDHNENFKQVLAKLSQIEAPVSFVSGDVHFSEIMSIEQRLLGYQTFEYTTSSIHSITWPWNHVRHGKNPRRISATPVHNFMVFDTKVDERAGWLVDAKCVNGGLKVKFGHQSAIRR